jgi:hypothetical protein
VALSHEPQRGLLCSSEGSCPKLEREVLVQEEEFGRTVNVNSTQAVQYPRMFEFEVSRLTLLIQISEILKLFGHFRVVMDDDNHQTT